MGNKYFSKPFMVFAATNYLICFEKCTQNYAHPACYHYYIFNYTDPNSSVKKMLNNFFTKFRRKKRVLCFKELYQFVVF